MILRAMVLLSVCLAGAAKAAIDEADFAARSDAPLWRQYVLRSRQLAAEDRNALAAEVAAAGLEQSIRAPSGGDFRPDLDDEGTLGSAESGQLADAVISFQTPSGGWSKHTGYARGPRRPGMQWTSQSEPGKRPHYQATFDNGATVREIQFLSAVWEVTKRDDCREAALRGLDFVVEAQFPNGGWPQVYPLEGGYHDNVTFNDNAMTNVLALLRDSVGGDPRYAYVDDERRARLAAALDRGLACVLAAQIPVDGRKTVWCAQHDPLTLRPVAARDFEPASLSGVESAQVIKFLMTLPKPSPEMIAAIEAGLAWLEAAQVRGLAKIKRDGRTIYAADPSSTDVYWARFYDLATGRPLFPGKDGIVYESFEAMAAANDKLGYDYYSTQPGSILRNGQAKWRKRLQDAR